VTELQWKPRIYLPVNLTVRFGAEVLTADDPAAWCRQKAAELLGPQARAKQVTRLADCLEEYAEYFSSRDLTTAAVFFYPDYTRIPPRAMSEVYLVGPDATTGLTMTLARAREIYAPDEHSFGETEMIETEVPAGPALRVHRFRKSDPIQRRSHIIEEVAWVICPPDSRRAVMMITAWGESAFSKPATTIADDMAQNFRTEPADDGSE
jgi:hypothetical protein